MFASTGPRSPSGPCRGRRSSPRRALPWIHSSNLSYLAASMAAHTKQGRHGPPGPWAVKSKKQRYSSSISQYQRKNTVITDVELPRHWEQQAPQYPCCQLEEVPSHESPPSRKCCSRQRPSSHSLNKYQVPLGKTVPTLSVHACGDKETPGWWAVTLPLLPEWVFFKWTKKRWQQRLRIDFEHPTRWESSARS